MNQQHPEALQPLLPEIEDFAKFCHMNVLHPILRYVIQQLICSWSPMLTVSTGSLQSVWSFLKRHLLTSMVSPLPASRLVGNPSITDMLADVDSIASTLHEVVRYFGISGMTCAHCAAAIHARLT